MSATKFFRRERIGNPDHGHTGRSRGFDSRGGIFDHTTFFGRNTEQFRRADKNIGRRFAILNVLHAYDRSKELAQIFHGEHDIDHDDVLTWQTRRARALVIRRRRTHVAVRLWLFELRSAIHSADRGAADDAAGAKP